MIDVAAVILENHNGDVLIAKRKKGKHLAGFWEFPGGKVELGETPQETLKRELKEEMGIKIIVKEYLGESIYRYDGQDTIRLLAFRGGIAEGQIRLVDHDDYCWVKVLTLEKVKLAPADIPLITYLK